MDLVETASWRITTDEPESLIQALYVRDAAGLRPQIEPAIPALEPAISSGGAGSTAGSTASVQWGGWWRQLLEGGGAWPQGKNPSDLAKLQDDAVIQRSFCWRSEYLPPDFAGLSLSPELQSLVRVHYEAAQLWSQARKHEFVALATAPQRMSLEGEIVRAVEQGRGRKARPFEFDIRVLPVTGVQAWRLSPGRALVTRALFKEREAYRTWLQPILEEVA
jgi:hypothetical protein